MIINRLGQEHETLPMTRSGNVFVWRIDVWNDTKRIAHNQALTPASASPTKKVKWDANFKVEGAGVPPIRVLNQDSIVAGLDLKTRGFRPAILNFADDNFPGGSVNIGSGAQEESLFRRTNLCDCLSVGFYPLRDDEGLWTPVATVFRDVEDRDNVILPLERRQELAFISVPGIKMPQLDAGGRLRDVDVARLRRKVELICQIAAKGGCDAVVLGALGCGAWRCPPADVARVFREVLVDGGQRGFFREVVFACQRVGESGYILRNRTGFPDNYDVFSAVMAGGDGEATP